MKRFRFKLETLLDVKKRKEERVQQELAMKVSQISSVKDKMGELHRSLKELQASQKHSRDNVTDIFSLKLSVSFRHKLKQDLLASARKIDDLSAESFEIQQRLIEATREKRALELIKEKEFSAWRKEFLHREQEFIDDISQKMHRYSLTGERHALS